MIRSTCFIHKTLAIAFILVSLSALRAVAVPTAHLDANTVTSVLPVNSGEQVTFNWSSSGGNKFESFYTVDGATIYHPWGNNNAGGSSVTTVSPKEVGHRIRYFYRVTDTASGQSATSSVLIMALSTPVLYSLVQNLTPLDVTYSMTMVQDGKTVASQNATITRSVWMVQFNTPFPNADPIALTAGFKDAATWLPLASCNLTINPHDYPKGIRVMLLGNTPSFSCLISSL